jgi:chromate transport protein ChrA
MQMQRLWPLIKMGLWLGGAIFGGLSQAYPYIRQRASDLGPITKEEIDALYTLAVFLPGPSLLNLWGAICARVAGLPGAVIGQLAMMAPAMSIVFALPYIGRIGFFAHRADAIMDGAIWATVGLILATGVDSMTKQSRALDWLLVAVMVATLVVGLHPLLLMVLVMCGAALTAHLQAERGSTSR